MQLTTRLRLALAFGLGLLAVGGALLFPAARAASAQATAETPQRWFAAGAQAARQAIREVDGAQRARNVIVFLGDGMGFTTVAAAHIYAGQRAGLDGESHRLSFEQFPYTALSRTYETNQQTPDSAGTMTAIMTGVKTKAGFIGIDQSARRGDCASAQGAALVTALQLAGRAGMATGAVTTTRITHATPAATYGHNPERNWEVDADLPPEARAVGCTDFAAQLIDNARAGVLDVALGGGRTEFMPAGMPDPQREGMVGQRLDGRNLIDEWLTQPRSAYVWNASELAAVDARRTRRLLGLFNPSHLEYDHDRQQMKLDEPTLAQMTAKAIEILRRDPEGYFLMVEGGRIDHALHAGNAFRALDETRAFAEAVAEAVRLAAGTDTLIVVTADHSHTLTFAGYPRRGNDILGVVVGANDSYDAPKIPGPALDALGQPYTTLGFANGPGYSGASNRQPEGAKHYPHFFSAVHDIEHGRPRLGAQQTRNPDYLQEATLPLKDETHAGEDVGIWASGPGARAFHGEFEQNAIFHLIVQQTPRLKAELCRLGACAARGVPSRLLRPVQRSKPVP